MIHESLEILHGCITTIHNVTGTQPITDMAMTKKKVSIYRVPPPVSSFMCFPVSVQMLELNARMGEGYI